MIKENTIKSFGLILVPFYHEALLLLTKKELVLVQKLDYMKNSKIISDRNNTIGRNVRRIRMKSEIGQTELVQKLQLDNIEITREALVKIESGKQHIKLEQLRGVKKVLKTSYDDLLE